MTLKQKVKTYSFWISIISALLIIVRIIGEHFGWFINEGLIMDIVTGVCGVLVLLGILSSPSKKEGSMEETFSNLKQESMQAQAEQESLVQTINDDIQAEQLTIEQQIQALRNQSMQKAEELKITHITPNITQDIVSDSIVPLTTDALINDVVVDNVVVDTQLKDNAETKPVETEDVAVLVTEEIPQKTAEEQVALLEVKEVEQPVAQTQSYSNAMQEQLVQQEPTVSVEELTTQTNNAQTEQSNSIDVSQLSTTQIKELLVQLLQRL